MADIFDKLTGDIFDEVAGDPIIDEQFKQPLSMLPVGPVDPTDPYAKKVPEQHAIVGALARGGMKVGQAVLGAPGNAVRQAKFVRQYLDAEAINVAIDPVKKKDLVMQMRENERTFDHVANWIDKPVELHKMGQRTIQEKHPGWESAPPKSFRDLLTRPDKLGIAIAESLPILVGAGILMAAGQTNIAAGFMYVTEGESAKEEALASGASDTEAAISYGVYGSVAAALETMQLQGLIRVSKNSYNAILNRAAQKTLKRGFGKTITGELVKTSIEEAIEEMAQGSWQEITAKMVYGKEIPGGVTDFIDRRAQEAYIAGMMALIPGAPGAVAGTRISTKPVVDIKTPIEPSREQAVEISQQVNVYKTTDDKTKGITEEQLDFDKETGKLTYQGKDVILDTEASGSGIARETGKTVFRAGEVIDGLMHFGTEAAAKKAATGRNIKQYKVTMNNPAKMVDSGRAHDKKPVALMEDIIAGNNANLDPQLVPVIKKIQRDQGDKEAFEAIRTALINHGYDGIEYTNNNEDKGSTSYITLAKEQVKEIPPIPERKTGKAKLDEISKPKKVDLPKLSKRVLLAKAHKIAKEKNIEREDYRDYAEIVTGKRSMKNMTNEERHKFVQALEESFGSATELTEDDFKKPIVINKKATTMDRVFGEAIIQLDNLDPIRKDVEVIKKSTYKSGLGSKLKHFFFGIDNTPVYHLANILDNGEEGIFSDVLDKNIQSGQKISMSHRREVHNTLIQLLNTAGIDPSSLSEISEYANPRESILRGVSRKFITPKVIMEFGGKRFEMTKAEILDIYLATQQEAGIKHVIEGGLVINGVKTGPISEDTILEIWDRVEADPKLAGIVNVVSYIDGNIWKPSLNQTSNKLDGKDIATIDNWWGLEVYMPKKLVGQQEIISSKTPELNLIEDKSILKDRTYSKSPLIIRDALARFSTFENAISEYVGMAEPTRISRTILNDPRVRAIVDQKGYNDVFNRIAEIHKRAQSIRTPEGNFSELIHRNLPGIYRAVLVFNAGVVASQATSSFNYGAYVSPEFMGSLKNMTNVELARLTIDISDIAWDRFFMGHSSLELGEAAKSDATLRFWTDKSSDVNKLGWCIKAADLMALTPGIDIAMREYEAARTGKLKGFSAEWWQDRADLPEFNLDMYNKVVADPGNAKPEDRQAAEVWKNTITERAEYLWQRTQPSWDKWNRSNLTSQRGLRTAFLLFRSFHEKSLTILNQAQLKYDKSAKTINDKEEYARKIAAVTTSYTVNFFARALIVAGMTFKFKDLYEYFKDGLTSMTSLFPILGKVLDKSIRAFLNSLTGHKHEYRGEPLDSLPIEVINTVLNAPETFMSAAGNMVEGDTEAAEKDLTNAIGKTAEGLGLAYGVPMYEIKKFIPSEGKQEDEKFSKRYK